MFDCTDIKALLSAIVDDQLDGETRHDVERHLTGCEGCRALISQTEAMDKLVAAEAQASLTGSTITPEFEGAVLSRTIYARPVGRIGSRMITFGGWFAAAASVALAGAIWYLEQRGPAIPDQLENPIAMNNPAPAGIFPASLQKSFVTTELQPRELFVRSDPQSMKSTHGFGSDQMSMPDAAPPLLLARADLDTLSSAALALELLREADTTSFADIEQVRRIVEYDNLLVRLEQARKRIPEHEGTLGMAKSFISRAVNGPVGIEDVKSMSEDITDLNLTQKIEHIGSRATQTLSL